MYQVMIIDDEELIRQSIRNRMDWENYGVEVAAEAENGQEALEMMEIMRFQIVLVDIRMPLVDGLSFLAEAKKQWPNVCYIIMSAYSDFEYARKAMQLGMKDYILKPVKVTELEKIIQKCVHELDEQRLSRQLRDNSARGNEKWMQLKGEQTAALTFYIEDQDGIEVMLEARIRDILAALEGERVVYYLEDYSRSDCYAFLIHGKALSEIRLQELAGKIWDGLREVEGAATWAETTDGDVSWVVRSSVTLLKQKLFYPERKILSPRQIAGKSEKERMALEDIRQAAREELDFAQQYCQRKEYGRLDKSLKRVVSLIASKNAGITFLEETIAEVLQLLKRTVSGREDEIGLDILFHQLKGKDYLLRFRTKEELEKTLQEAIEGCMQAAMDEEDMDIIEEIRQYIKGHYEEDLNAAQLAGKFHLNSSYLSTKFKGTTGMNLGAYIEGIRMEKAQKFLATRDWSITEIAMKTGYTSSNYFAKVFRRYAGMTPKEYRENSEGKMEE